MARVTTFGRKLGLGFFVVVILTMTMGAVSIWALRTVVDEKDAIIQVSTENLIDAQLLSVALQEEVASYRGYLLIGDDTFNERLAEADAEFSAALGRIRDRGLPPDHERLLNAVERAESDHQREVDHLVAERRSGRAAIDLVHEIETRLHPRREAFEASLAEFVAAERASRDAQRDSASSTAATATTIVIGLSAGVVLLAIAIASVLSRGLAVQVGSTVQQVRSSSAELHAAASQQASSSKEQATAMREIATTIGELLATSRQIAASSQQVARIAADTATGAKEGDDRVRGAEEAVRSIRGQVDAIVAHMLDLGRKSQQIGGILELINELAEQTNILAINATIEAAGAGEHGRRFAVVGEEVRRLADRVSSSTKEVRGLIDEIRAAVNSTVMATEAGSKSVDSGAERFLELATAFRKIGDLVGTTTEAAREIELSTKQQATAVEQVNVAIANVAQTTKESEASSSQTLQTASELAALSSELALLVQPAASDR